MSRFITRTIVAASAVGFLAVAISLVNAQAPGGSGGRGGGRGGGGGRGIGAPVFTAVDTNKDGSVKRAEMKSAFEAWYAASDKTKAGSITQSDLQATITPVINVAVPESVSAMVAALPTSTPAKPAKARKILVYGNSEGFIHSSIPLAARMVEELGKKDKLWTTTITYDPRDINAANLKQYDLIFLASTTGCFLDDPGNKAVSEQRRKDFMDFIRSGKGIAGIHAASDSYHTDCSRPQGGGSSNPVTLAALIMTQGDTNGDKKLSKQEMSALADAWFDKMDPGKTGMISQSDFATRFNADVNPAAAGGGFGGGFGGGRGGSGGGRGGRGGSGGGRGGGFGQAATGPWTPLGETPPGTVLEWPEWNKLIGGYFKFHWVDPQLITTKIDDPNSPLTAMFHGQEFEIHDETYTFAQDSFSRKNVHMLTSIDYAKMSDEDKHKEGAASGRTDGDYALSYIRAEGKGRMFYEAHGHDDKVYAMTPILEHMRAGIQYALGDLKADDSPSVK